MSIRMKITQYGYADDPYMDSETKKGHGAYHDLERGISCALTDSAKAALGATKRCWVRISFGTGNDLIRRYDDRAPEHDKRCDLYMVDGFNKSISDYGEVSLTTAPLGHQ